MIQFSDKEFDTIKSNDIRLKFILDRMDYNLVTYNICTPYEVKNVNDMFSEYKWYWITLNYREGTEVEEIQKFINRYIVSTYISKYIYNYEQRSEVPNVFKGIHNHILIAVKRGIKNPQYPAHIRAKLKQKFRHAKLLAEMCDVKNKNILNIKCLKSPKEVQRKISLYLNGDKQKSKMKKVNIDSFFRKKYGLKKYYKKNIKVK